MKKDALAQEQKKAEADLYIIVAVTAAVLIIYMSFQDVLNQFADNKSIPILVRTFVVALQQFGVAGLGVAIVSVFRKESFSSHGLRAKGTLLSILLCVLAFIPNIIFMFASGRISGYMPFQSVWVTGETLASPFPVNVIGMMLITAAWGFFEGFNYVVISDKINKRFPGGNKWLNWGAIISGIICLLIHGLIGITPEDIFEAVTVFAIIYGMLMVKEYTKNAWGCVFIFVFLWNAF